MCAVHQETRSESLVIYAIKSQHRPKLAPLSLVVLNQVLYHFPCVAFTCFTHDIARRIKLYHLKKRGRKLTHELFPVLHDCVKSDKTHKKLQHRGQLISYTDLDTSEKLT